MAHWLWIIPAAGVLLLLPIWFQAIEQWFENRRQFGVIKISRMGYVYGRPDRVVCEDCGTDCRRYKSLWRKNLNGRNEMWTEFICPACVGTPKGN